MYIDPGTGSLLIQVLIGVIIAIPVALKLFWGRIKKWFTQRKAASGTRRDR